MNKGSSHSKWAGLTAAIPSLPSWHELLCHHHQTLIYRYFTKKNSLSTRWGRFHPNPPLFHLACSEVNSTKDPKLLEWPWATEAQDSREAKYLAHPLEKENHQIKRYLFWNRDMYGYVSSQQGYQSTSICLESIYIPISIYIYISIFIKVYQFNSIYTSWHKLEGKSWRYAILKKVTQHLPSRTKISHLWKRKIIFKIALVGDMLVPRRAHIVSICTLYQYMYPPAGKWIPAWWRSWMPLSSQYVIHKDLHVFSVFPDFPLSLNGIRVSTGWGHRTGVLHLHGPTLMALGPQIFKTVLAIKPFTCDYSCMFMISFHI